MIVKCPQCGGKLDLPDDAIGWRVQRAYCDGKFRAMESLVLSETGSSSDSDEVLSVNLDALEADENERRKWEERETIWRERIQIRR